MEDGVRPEVRAFVDEVNAILGKRAEELRGVGAPVTNYPCHARAMRARSGDGPWYALHGPPNFFRKDGDMFMKIDGALNLYNHHARKPLCNMSDRDTWTQCIGVCGGLHYTREMVKRRREERDASPAKKPRQAPAPPAPLTRTDGTPLQVGDTLVCRVQYAGCTHHHVFYRVLTIGKTLGVAALKKRSEPVYEGQGGSVHNVFPTDELADKPAKRIRIDGLVERVSASCSIRCVHYDPSKTFQDVYDAGD